MSRSLLEQLKHFLTAGDEAAPNPQSIANLIDDIVSDVDDIRSDVGLIDGDTSAMRSNLASISIDTNKLEDDMSRGVTNLGGKVECVTGTTVSGSLTFTTAGLGVVNNARIRMISMSCENATTSGIFRISLDGATCWEGYFNSRGMGFLILRFGEFWEEWDTFTISRLGGSAAVEAKVTVFYEDLANDSANYANG